jgi:hypothetical protein
MGSIFEPSFVNNCRELARQAGTPFPVQVKLIPEVLEFMVDQHQ